MIVCTTWKQRPLTPEQSNRLMTTWGKLEAAMAEHPDSERLAFYLFADGTGGVAIEKYHDIDAANAFGLEAALALGEFIEVESHIVLDLESALPAITKAMERINS